MTALDIAVLIIKTYIDKNECESEENPCGEHSVCVNVVGGYTCECDVGFLASYRNTSSTRFCQGEVIHKNKL